MQMNKFIEGVKINIDRIKQLYEGKSKSLPDPIASCNTYGWKNG